MKLPAAAGLPRRRSGTTTRATRTPTSTAYPGYYLTADAGYKDEDGYLWIMSRTDDVINVAGHRLSAPAQMEEVLAAHPDIAECAVVGVNDALKGEVPLGLVVLKAGAEPGPDGAGGGAGRAGARSGSGRWRRFKTATVVKRLPKTRSGKIVRGTIKKIADGVAYTVPPTIDDPAILEEISASIWRRSAIRGWVGSRGLVPRRGGAGQLPSGATVAATHALRDHQRSG